MAQRILALELGADRVRAAMAERSWNSFTLAGTYDKVRADDEADLSGALSRLVVESGQPDIVISALPADRAVKRLLELPFKDARRLPDGGVVMCHPGKVDAELSRLDPLTDLREREYAFFSDEAFPQLLVAHGVALS